MNATQSSGRVVSRGRSSHGGRRRGAGIGGSRNGHTGAGGRGRGRRRGIRFTGILAATGGGLLASLLGLGVIGVVVDALAESGLADIEGDGLDVLGDIRGLSIVALAAELQCRLEGIILTCHLRCKKSESVTSHLPSHSCSASCHPCTVPGRHCAGPGTTSLSEIISEVHVLPSRFTYSARRSSPDRCQSQTGIRSCRMLSWTSWSSCYPGPRRPGSRG